MWTENGKKMFCKQLSTSWTANNSMNNFSFIDCTNTPRNMNYNVLINNIASDPTYHKPGMTELSTNNNEYCFWDIYIGTGTTLPTKDDITLEAPVEFTLPVKPQISRGNNYTTILITYTFTNNTKETKTITEIGLCTRVANQSPAVLLNRRLLDTPVVMNAGDSKVFTFTIDTSNLSE